MISGILPDFPNICAMGAVLAIIYFSALWLGVTLCGGGILAVLLYIGACLGGVSGIPPAIMGIIYLGIIFSILGNIFKLLI